MWIIEYIGNLLKNARTFKAKIRKAAEDVLGMVHDPLSMKLLIVRYAAQLQNLVGHHQRVNPVYEGKAANRLVILSTE